MTVLDVGRGIPIRPVFSIIMNIYNGEAYLDAAINSVLAQSFQDWELIIWDDRSDDASASICRQYRDPRIRYYLSSLHTQIGKARNLAIAQAHGEWLAFLDQDDIWMPDKLLEQHGMILADPSRRLGIVYGRTIQFDAGGMQRDFDRWHEFSPLPEGEVFNLLLARPSFICLSSAVLLKAAVDEFGGIPDDIHYCPDYYLFVGVARHYRAAALQKVCCWYRNHPGNMSSKFKIQIYLEALEIIERQADIAESKVVCRRRCVYHSLIGLHEIASGKAIVDGIRRIVEKGSVLYLLFLPILSAYRSLRRLIFTRVRQALPPGCLNPPC